MKRPNLKDYLFTTPPFKKITAKDLQKTLEELESVPSGFFHYALEDKRNFIFLHKTYCFIKNSRVKSKIFFLLKIIKDYKNNFIF